MAAKPAKQDRIHPEWPHSEDGDHPVTELLGSVQGNMTPAEVVSLVPVPFRFLDGPDSRGTGVVRRGGSGCVTRSGGRSGGPADEKGECAERIRQRRGP